MAIVYRLDKGAPLTHAELDGNFNELSSSITTLNTSVAALNTKSISLQDDINSLELNEIASLQSSVTTLEATAVVESERNVANGFAGLDASGNLPATVLVRKGTAAQLGAIVLGDGELAIEVDSEGTPSRIRMGDGETAGGVPSGGVFYVVSGEVLADFSNQYTVGFKYGLTGPEIRVTDTVSSKTHSLSFPDYSGFTHQYTLISRAGQIPVFRGLAQSGDSPATRDQIEGLIMINSVDNNIKMYADGGWRTLATW